MRTFIIHLERSADRLENVHRMMSVLPNAEIANAIDGHKLAEHEIRPVYVRNLNTLKYPFDLSKTEIGCFLSHRSCWKKIAAGPDEFGIVAEDDLDFDMDQFNTALALAKRHASSDKIIRFPQNDHETIQQLYDSDQGCQIYRPVLIGLGFTLMLIGRDAAQKMLDLTKSFDRPVDTFFQMRWSTGLDIHSVFPNGLRLVDPELTGSTIHSKNTLVQKFPRTIRRFWYRSQVNSMSRKGK